VRECVCVREGGRDEGRGTRSWKFWINLLQLCTPNSKESTLGKYFLEALYELSKTVLLGNGSRMIAVIYTYVGMDH